VRKIRKSDDAVKKKIGGAAMQDAAHYFVGIGGWEHDVLNSCFYPDPGAATSRKLAYYARWFNTVEVRPTFWDDTLDEGDAQEWVAAVQERREFLFNVKLHSSFTHARTPNPVAQRNMEGLLTQLQEAGRLGAVLAQFPYSFSNTGANRQQIEKLAIAFVGFPLHIELRHASWDYQGLTTLLSDLHVGAVNVDMPRVRQFIPYLPRVIGRQAYIRLHGRNEKGWLLNTFDGRYDYLYNGRELQEIRRRVFALPQSCSRAFVVWNNTTGGKAVANALQCMALLRGAGSIPAPAAALQAFPWLKEVIRTASEDLPLFGEEYRPAV
jgi:uncharacterized protein YecE (DUF72 family)